MRPELWPLKLPVFAAATNNKHSLQDRYYVPLRIVYIGERYMITPPIMPATATHIALAFATLGVAT